MSAEEYPRSSGYPVATSDESNTDTESFATHVQLRPNMIRRDTDHILSYYQSEHAGLSYGDRDSDQEQRPVLKRGDSSSSKSSSEYSLESLDGGKLATTSQDLRFQPVAHGHHTRRPSVPTQESVDRRRLAIVEVDSALHPSVSRRGSGRENRGDFDLGVFVPSTLLARRGIHVNGLALVAPPDASPSTYTDLTPPPSAPVVVGGRFPVEGSASAVHHHSRSASEAVGGWTNLRHKTSRDVGIVGTGSRRPVLSRREQHQTLVDDQSLRAPIFQTPTKSRSPSPAVHTPDLSDSATSSFSEFNRATPGYHMSVGGHEEAHTPAIGEGKDILQPVVGPVITNLESEQVLRLQRMQSPDLTEPVSPSAFSQVPSPVSSYLYYQPGVHSTAGPLPPPPKLVFEADKPTSEAPPRPPRTIRTPLPPGPSITLSSPPKHDLDALKESLQLPSSVSAVLASRSNSRAELKRNGTDVSWKSEVSNGSKNSDSPSLARDAKRSHSVHRREGAFPPSVGSTSTPENSPLADSAEPNPNSLRQTTIHSSTPRIYAEQLVVTSEPEVIDESEIDNGSGWRLHRENSWISLREEARRTSSPNGRAYPSLSKRSLSRSLSRSPSLQSPPPPPKIARGLGVEDLRTPSGGGNSSNPFRATLTNLKRFSALPRTPSQMSLVSKPSSDRHSRTPSPSYISPPIAPPRDRIINAWPDAMQFRDILAKSSTRERSAAYAQKIQELSTYDSGLRDWIIATKARQRAGRGLRSSVAQSVPGPSLPSTMDFHPQPRHTSDASVSSQTTFPIRNDAYIATDLSMRPGDELTSTKSPPLYLPYPALASSPLRSASALPSAARSYQVPLSNGPPRSGTGFFASMGRKASLKKDRGPTISPPSPSRVLTKRFPNQNNQVPRALQLNSAPAIRGGPRAAPGRVQRSQTISIAPAPTQEQPVTVARSETSHHRQSTSNRRPSIFHRSTQPAAVAPVAVASPEFERQVDRLADLLPNADKKLLSAYLRRAGEDVLAIGQYLEDEKNGTLRYD